MTVKQVKMVESTSSLPKCSRRNPPRCAEGRGNPLTNALLTRRRRHKTVHFGDFTEKLGAYCTEIPNCCKLSSICGYGGETSKNCPLCSNNLLNGWSSLETIQSALNDKLKKPEDNKLCKSLNLMSCESNNPNCRICKEQNRSRRRKKSTEPEKADYSDMKMVPVRPEERVCSKSLPNELKFEPNVKELFSFIESVLSSWFVEEGAYTSQGESENDERSKSFDSDEGDKAKTDDDDVFQITIEKHKKENRKQKKTNENDFNEISLEFDCGIDKKGISTVCPHCSGQGVDLKAKEHHPDRKGGILGPKGAALHGVGRWANYPAQ